MTTHDERASAETLADGVSTTIDALELGAGRLTEIADLIRPTHPSGAAMVAAEAKQVRLRALALRVLIDRRPGGGRFAPTSASPG